MYGTPVDCPLGIAAGVPGAGMPGMLRPDDTCAACGFGETLDMACGDEALEPLKTPPPGRAIAPALPDEAHEPLADPAPAVAEVRATMCDNVLQM